MRRKLVGAPVLSDAVSGDPDRLDPRVERQRPAGFGEPGVDGTVCRGHPAECPEGPGFLSLREAAAAEHRRELVLDRRSTSYELVLRVDGPDRQQRPEILDQFVERPLR